MAGYSKGIVDTRKLNKNSKAKLGRGGDTEIRKVDNKKSHVNVLEAYLIDVNGKAGEDYAKRVGAGTINPLTGMPEYHPHTEMHTHIDVNNRPVSDPYDDDVVGYTIGNDYYDNDGNLLGGMELVTPQGGWAGGENPYLDPPPPNPHQQNGLKPKTIDYSYEGLKDVTGEQLTAFDKTLGKRDLKYFQGIFTDRPFDFIEDQYNQSLREGKSAYGATMGALGSQQAALSRTTGRGFREAGKSRDIAASRSGLATSGTIAQAYETQKKDLFQDYTAGMGDIQRERGAALDTLTLGKDTAALDLAKGTYTEEQRQLDEYWDMIAMRQSV